MPLTLADFRSLVYRYLDENPSDVSNPRFPSSLITTYLNSAQCEVLSRLYNLDYFRESSTVDATQAEIAVPRDYLSAMRCVYKPTSGSPRLLQQTTFEALDKTDSEWETRTATDPTHFVFKVNGDGAQTIFLYPLMAATVVDGLRMTYTARPDDMVNDTDTSPVTAAYPDLEPFLLPAFVCGQLKLFENGTQDEQYQKWLTIFDNYLRRFVSRLNSGAMGTGVWG